jgi:hypothetical protein
MNPATLQHMTNMVKSSGGWPPGMAQYHVLASEGKQRYKIHKNPKIN